tara:strand:+ start:1763 stop:2407 length:645 start_codon:yes stop_codon:yes gene_type:complete
MPQILKVDPLIPTLWEDLFAKTKKVLKAGGIIAFPTDTFYGLGADPFNKTAVDKIYKIKNRDSKKPLLLLIDSLEKLDELVEEPSKDSVKLIENFWPGPLTILFKPKSIIPENITTGLLGLRQPGHAITRKLLSVLDHPLTAPSANFSGKIPATTAKQVALQLGNKLDLVLDAGTCKGEEPSTLVDATQKPVRLIREGAISFKCIQKSLGALQT